MKKIVILILLNLNIFGLTFCIEDIDNSPFINKQTSGILVEIIKKSLSNLKIDYNFKAMPWKRCLRDLERGEVDASFAIIWSKERSEKYLFPMKNGEIDNSKSIWDAEYKVFTSKESKLILRNGKFENTTFGLDAPPGYIARELLEKAGVATEQSHQPEAGLTLTLKNRIDGYIINELIGLELMKRVSPTKAFKVLDEPFLTSSWFVPFSKKYYEANSKMVEQIWMEVTKVRKNWPSPK